MKKIYETGAWSERDGSLLTIGKGDKSKSMRFRAEDKIDLRPLHFGYAEAVRKVGKNPDDFCMAGMEIIARQFIPEIEACIAYAKEAKKDKQAEEKIILDEAIADGTAFRAVEVAPQWGASLCWARRFTDNEKADYAEWYRDRGMVGFAGDKEIKVIDQAVRQVIGDRTSDGCFLGCTNSAWIITEAEWNQIISVSKDLRLKKLQNQKRFEKEEAADLQNKIDTGYCFNCETWCNGDCGNYQPSPDYKFKRDHDEATREQNYGIQEG